MSRPIGLDGPLGGWWARLLAPWRQWRRRRAAARHWDATLQRLANDMTRRGRQLLQEDRDLYGIEHRPPRERGTR